jgi:phosphatidylserine/phosphatidylglycerophosphate/cardiolipin synthase-like enzyme
MSRLSKRLQGARVRLLALAGLVATTGSACALAAASIANPLPAAAPLLPIAQPVSVGADTLTLLRSGAPTFRELHRLLDDAKASIHVEVYEFGNRTLIDAVEAARSRGVAVTVIDDPSEQASAVTALELRSRGIDVIDYPVRKLMIDHVKLLVVDGSVAVVGGINWGTKSPANHDYDAEVHGPVVQNLDRVFLRDVITCGHQAAVPSVLPDSAILVAATLPAAEIKPLALAVINGARRSLDLELFVLTDTSIVRALETARARGIAIHVLLDPSQHSSDPSFQALTTSGVDVRWYRTHGELLHAKAIVADGSTLLFGSANWSGGGFMRNHELDILVESSPPVAQAMLEQMRLDWKAST